MKFVMHSTVFFLKISAKNLKINVAQTFSHTVVDIRLIWGHTLQRELFYKIYFFPFFLTCDIQFTLPPPLKLQKINILRYTSLLLNTLHAAIVFTIYTKSFCEFQILKNSHISKPIPGMFVLIWMHFAWGFQILSPDPRISKFLTLLWHF